MGKPRQLEIDHELEELIGRDWTVNLTAAEIAHYDAEEERRRGLDLVAGLAMLCGLEAKIVFGELEIRRDGMLMYSTRSPGQSMDWIDGYATCYTLVKEKKR